MLIDIGALFVLGMALFIMLEIVMALVTLVGNIIRWSEQDSKRAKQAGLKRHGWLW